MHRTAYRRRRRRFRAIPEFDQLPARRHGGGHPVWFVEAGRRLLVKTDASSYKVRRIRRDPRGEDRSLHRRRSRGTPVILELTES